jgi:hypothetical protein
VRATGQKGLSELTVDARQSGFPFNAAGLAIRACVYDGKNWWTAGIAEVKSQEAGTANIRLSLPAEVLPLTEFYTPIELAVASSDGQYVAYGGFAAIGRVVACSSRVFSRWPCSGGCSTCVTTRGCATKGSMRTIGRAGAPGCSSALTMSPASRCSKSFFGPCSPFGGWSMFSPSLFTVTGTLLSLTAEMMTLLGIAGTGSVLARLIASRQAPATSPPVYLSPPGSPSEFWQILSTKNSFDLMKLQLFVFTLVIGVYVVWRITDTATFPALDANTLLLLGVSQGIYVGGKFSA